LPRYRLLFDRYELWYFIYNTGNPIAYSGMLLRDALTKTVAEIDPEGKDPGLKDMIVMGHSQGGLLTKMTAIDSGMRLWPFSVPPEGLRPLRQHQNRPESLSRGDTHSQH
jgi:hypothetical protein